MVQVNGTPLDTSTVVSTVLRALLYCGLKRNLFGARWRYDPCLRRSFCLDVRWDDMGHGVIGSAARVPTHPRSSHASHRVWPPGRSAARLPAPPSSRHRSFAYMYILFTCIHHVLGLHEISTSPKIIVCRTC